MSKVLQRSGVSKVDWFRLAQNRGEWHNIIEKAFPKQSLDKEGGVEVDRWRPGRPMPGVVVAEAMPVEEVAVGPAAGGPDGGEEEEE
eukprot:11072344-Heterocapsa_arctica.AAC.1